MKFFAVVLSFMLVNFISCETDLKNWWRKEVIYQIYPRSFMDSDGDGIGDLKGIISKLDYFVDLGVGVTWLSPIYKSPMKDFGYDISNYTAIEPIFGTMEDFLQYVNVSKKLGLKVVMDFVPNHSSDEHPWFLNSVDRIEPYTDYYVWADGRTVDDMIFPPNNWVSVFGNSMWTWNEKRGQYYLHQFLKEQPDLNFTNPNVRQEMKDILKFWLNNGVDGFRIDAIKHLFEDPEFRDEPRNPFDKNAKPDEYNYYDHKYTIRDHRMFDVLLEWREVLNDFERNDGLYRLMMVESLENITLSLPYFGNDTYPLTDIPFNVALFTLNTGFTAANMHKTIDEWLQGMPADKWSNWITGNHDNKRIANRTDPMLIDAFNMVCLLLRGTPITYYGEEIGMVDRFIAWDEIQDPNGKDFGPDRYAEFNRDPERTPMQWNDKPFAGFTQGNKTWLPVNENFQDLNVEAQMQDPRSHLSVYKELVALKKEPAVINGSVDYPLVTENIFSFCRLYNDSPAIAVVINVGSSPQIVGLGGQSSSGLYHIPEIGTLVAASEQFETNSFNIKIDLSYIKLPPYQAIVVKFDPIWL